MTLLFICLEGPTACMSLTFMVGKLQYWINQQVLERVTASDGTNQYRVVSFMSRVILAPVVILRYNGPFFFVCLYNLSESRVWMTRMSVRT